MTGIVSETQRQLWINDAGERRGAVISRCGRYRYSLHRQWSDAPIATFLMLNPSTADANADDPTIRKCIGFAKQWSQAKDGGGPFGGIVVVNLFAYRSTDPAGLLNVDDVEGPYNGSYLSAAIMTSKRLVVAWGASGPSAVRALVKRRVASLAPVLALCSPLCLSRSADGSPRHPLMLAYSTPLEPWSAP